MPRGVLKKNSDPRTGKRHKQLVGIFGFYLLEKKKRLKKEISGGGGEKLNRGRAVTVISLLQKNYHARMKIIGGYMITPWGNKQRKKRYDRKANRDEHREEKLKQGRKVVHGRSGISKKRGGGWVGKTGIRADQHRTPPRPIQTDNWHKKNQLIPGK